MKLFKKQNQPVPVENGEKSPATLSAPQKRPGRIGAKSKIVKDPDKYFEKLAGVMRVSRLVVVVILIVFSVAMAFLYSNEITAENLKLLVRNASFSFPGEKIAFTSVRYDADPAMDYAAYREYLAVATTGGMRLYDHRGNIALDEPTKMTCPTLCSGEDYILVYDREGKNYLVCNSVTSLYEGNEDYPIYMADIANDGSYAIMTGSSSYLSVIKVYNRSFKLKKELKVERLPLSLSISPDGGKLMFLSCTAGKKGLPEGHVTLYELGEKTETGYDLRFDEVPLFGAIGKDGGATVLFADCVRFFDKSGTETGSVSFEEGIPALFAEDSERLAVALETDKVLSEYRILVFDTGNGTEYDSFDCKGRIEKLFAAEDSVFLCEKDRISVRSAKGSETVLYEALPEKIFGGFGDTVFLCGKNKAENIFSKLQTDTANDGENV